MLTRLYIANYALIDQLEIEFNDGLTIITGETGAGKSIIMGALSLILGERADTHAIRDRQAKTIVEATFDIKDYRLNAFFDNNDIDYYEHECIVRREIGVNGRSRAFVNDTAVTVSVLRELTSHLVDIHSQHSNMLLSRPQFQLSVLDNIAGNASMLKTYSARYSHYKALQSMLRSQQESYNKGKAEMDYLRFQLNQFDELKLHKGEEDELEELQKKLSNVTDSKEALWKVETALDGEENSIISQLSTLSQVLADTENNLSEIAGLSDRMQSAVIELKDIAHSVMSVNDDLNDDPEQLEQVTQRLDAIYSLERKHNVKSVDELLDIEARYRRQIEEIDNSDERIGQLKHDIEVQEKELASLSHQLSTRRKQAASDFVCQLLPLAQGLGMKNLKFDVKFIPVGYGPSGCDAVEFLFAFNKNQDLLPVQETASGGEISRLMLSIKTIIARIMNLPTIIFDEVDTGVSGDIASRIGDMMGDIAKHIQVIAITHLPQVAAHGMHHMKVFKTDAVDGTYTSVQVLNREEHVLEIARMLSGKDVNQAAIDNAKSLVAMSE
ncbi:DNA repair protein RecN [Sodaliphilus pleomorphus]|uniref:DNA repair protein RecN n=1 Tax=Sodaliphilus pleomorphus TaxID=2606626 RepID=A0A6L5XEG1_9BACT|nr:DNA repair protein RecN [Sodaliphilus pleomorphus]MSS17853.1 DNA repair protein RecN [Sodaliphilus pleomorphus]